MINWNCTNSTDLPFDCWKVILTITLLGIMLVISLMCNIFGCASKYCSGKRRSQLRKAQSQSSRQMEENPIYGNLHYTESSLYTESDPPHSSFSSTSVRDPCRVNSDSLSKNQECYANLTLKAPRLQSGCSSTLMQGLDVILLEEPREEAQELEKEDDGNADITSTMSDLYASVQTRTKIIESAGSGEDYANHL
ncbi:signaling threshold-regulating transmembrane adapter 1-like isoform 2-T2 [Pholidichthys leucotaenia]